MALKKKGPAPKEVDQIVAEARYAQALREASYRGRALKLFPHVCGRCGREFSGKELRELTVHHKDHNHTNNPNDGSNWELLCLYCHDDEHGEYTTKVGYSIDSSANANPEQPLGFRPFEGLEGLLKPKSAEADSEQHGPEQGR